ncbi:mandelate racemase/muconate lactonizing enzyme family protein [Megasphaera elsdenii]|uniref:mandelate racemase/muconate lactonizing enzyme family protein n=1 Tax=Megasphaera elsdenii TaxID=907 RepID=UPI00242FF203|nr:dipeptide epimerase [Megasphaera elsdenii]
MKITAIEIGKIAIPLKTPFITALRRVDVAEDLVVKVYTDDGHTGYGNAPATVVITGDSHESVAAAIRYTIGPKLIGRDIDDREDILDTIHQSMVHNTSAKAALDMAVHDLFGQRYGLPLYRFFGGRKTRIASDITISINDPAGMAADACQAVALGYRHLKLKVGIDPAIDFQRVAAIRQAVGPDITIRLDANQGWKPKEAIRLIGRMEDAGLDIELVEQPVAAADFEGLKQVTDHVATDIMADESAFSAKDVFRLLAMRACDLINIKLMKAGGLGPAAQIAAMADAAGVGCMMGCMLESKVGITAAAALSAGKAVITKNDLDAADLMAADPVRGGITYDKDHLVVPDAPGLGITAIEGWQPLKD